jgi:uncharacterized protein (TIGR02145 family)
MKKLIIVMFALLTAGMAFGQDKEVAILQPKVLAGAVSENYKLIIISSMTKAFKKIEGYRVFTRESQALIDAEMEFQRSGKVSDASIKKIGAQTAASYICTFTLAFERNELVVNSDIIDVVSGEIIRSDFVTLLDRTNRDDVLNQCISLAYSLLEKSYGTENVKTPANNTNVTNPTANTNISNSDYVIIAGIKWATKNVSDTPGKWVSSPQDKGGYYTWETAKSACPSGWRLPNKDELETLINSGSTWTTKGRKFGSGSNKIFMPAAGFRIYNVGSLYFVGESGFYWSSTPSSSEYAYLLLFGGSANMYLNNREDGQSVRCVAE